MPALARAAIGDSLLNVVTGIGTAKDPRTSTRYHLRLLEKNVLEHMYRGDVGGELTPYRSPPFSRRSRALLSAFKRFAADACVRLGSGAAEPLFA